MSHNITVEGGTSVLLPTAGKYCDQDIVITATGGETAYVIKAGTYTLSPAPDVSFIHTGNLVSNYLYADMPLNNSTKLSWGYGLNIENGKIILLSAPVSITYTLTGTTIYQNGAYVDNYSNRYRVGCDVAVTKEFYEWWVANTV